ncbi:MAG: peptidylprolyl isomerase [Halobacteriovoraceae bacterium]|nr:peptidylprolyl isomerase [Peredibacter sp.]MBJ01148.1 peptidylprolyl isomerase [Halobacteriovoraceae bacterium]|tara:strand:- start:410 stop:685 length:276 start_codon:yes stop_codon:yes gene_type:complete
MTNKITASHILVDQKFEAQDILKKLNDGQSFEKLAQDYSNCGSAKQGGSLGEFGKGMMVAPFEQAAFALNPGEISDIVQTQFGYHIIKRDK